MKHRDIIMNTSELGKAKWEPFPHLLDDDDRSFRLPAEYAYYRQVSSVVCTLFCSAMLGFGTYGNVMIILLMHVLRNVFDDHSTRLYFLSLAAVDQTLLVTGVGRKVVASLFRYDVRTFHVAVCKVHKFLVFASGRMDTWILVALTFQRVNAVVRPLQHRLTNTTRRAVVIIAAIAVMTLLLDMPILVTYTLERDIHAIHLSDYNDSGTGARQEWVCKASDDNTYIHSFYRHWSHHLMQSVVGFVLPSLLLVVNNSILMHHVRRSSDVPLSSHHRIKAARTRQINPLTLTLMLTSGAFIVLSAPIPITQVIRSFSKDTTSARVQADLWMAKRVLDVVWYLNSCVNFYLYLLLGPAFREHVVFLTCGPGSLASRVKALKVQAAESTPHLRVLTDSEFSNSSSRRASSVGSDLSKKRRESIV